MKHSIRFKITFFLTLMIVAIIFITWCINRTFLMDYYVDSKIKTLINVYDEIIDIYQNSSSSEYLSMDDTERMERLESKYNIEVNVINQNLAMIYPASENFGKRETMFVMDRVMGYLFPGANPYMENINQLAKTKDYWVNSLYDRQMETNYIDILGFFHNPTENTIFSDNKQSNINSSSSSITNQTDEENNGTTDNSKNTDNTANTANTDNSANTDNTNNPTDGKDGNNNSGNNNPSNNNAVPTIVPKPVPTQNPQGNYSNPVPQNPQGINHDISRADTVVFLRFNLKSIEESSAIANKFLAYIGIIVIVLGTLAMFITSKIFTKPILELSRIAKKMTDLNFEVKYKVKSKDEISLLGESINTLSDKLETTITELKQANNELQTDIQNKNEIDEMRKEFLSNVSHELKTPISLIQGYAEGLKENINDDDESRDFYCEVIIDEANKMNQMVKKLLSLNELEFGNNQVNYERFDLVSLIRSVLSATDILFKQKEVTLYFEQKEPLYVWADEYLIEQVLTNYISNALHHSGGQKIIEIKIIPRDNNVRIAVFNTGENIPEEDLDKIWIKFYKVDKARTREYGGNGIGLSIVKAIMNSHNRECGVINRAVGVEFWFELDMKS